MRQKPETKNADPPTGRTDILNRLGIRLWMVRRIQGWTIKGLAESIGCSDSVLCKIEKGHQLPSIPLLIRIVSALGVSMRWILEEEGQNMPTLSALSGPNAPCRSDRLKSIDVKDLARSGLKVNRVSVKPGKTVESITFVGDEATCTVASGAISLRFNSDEIFAWPGQSFRVFRRDHYSYINRFETTLELNVFSTDREFRQTGL